MRGCSTEEAKVNEIGGIFARRKFGVLALTETTLKAKETCEFEVAFGKSRAWEVRLRGGVVLQFSDWMAMSVMEWKGVSSRLMCVKVNLGVKRWAFVSAHGPVARRVSRGEIIFWIILSALEDTYSVMVLGDLNARVRDQVQMTMERI